MPKIYSKGTWKKVAFGDVVRQVKDKIDPKKSSLDRYIAGEHMDTDDLKIRRWGVIGGDYLGPAFHMRFKPGHVLYGSRRTYPDQQWAHRLHVRARRQLRDLRHECRRQRADPPHG